MKPEPEAPKRKPARPPQEEHVDLPTVVQRPHWGQNPDEPEPETVEESWGKAKRTGVGRDKDGHYIERTYHIDKERE